MELMKEKKRFSIVARLKSTTHAWRGFVIFFKSTHNFWVQIFCALIVVYFGFYYAISSVEWVMISFAIGLVFITEAFNTAIEIDIDLTSPTYHPYARDTKDVAAAAVAIAAMTSIIVGLIIFLPKIF